MKEDNVLTERQIEKSSIGLRAAGGLAAFMILQAIAVTLRLTSQFSDVKTSVSTVDAKVETVRSNQEHGQARAEARQAKTEERIDEVVEISRDRNVALDARIRPLEAQAAAPPRPSRASTTTCSSSARTCGRWGASSARRTTRSPGASHEPRDRRGHPAPPDRPRLRPRPGGADGRIGPVSRAAIMAALQLVGRPSTAKPVDVLEPAIVAQQSPIPADWLPPASMQRVIVHWTAGPNYATALDKAYHHLMIEGDGAVKRGNSPITANAAELRDDYAAHTARCNTGSIGVSLCGMAEAVERRFSAGASPITAAQWAALASVLAQPCRVYRIPIRPEAVLTHAEVQPTLGIAQAGNIAALPFDPAFPRNAKASATGCAPVPRPRSRPERSPPCP